MNLATLIRLLHDIEHRGPSLPVTILAHYRNDVTEFPLRNDGPIVTLEAGGAAPAFVALNVDATPTPLTQAAPMMLAALKRCEVMARALGGLTDREHRELREIAHNAIVAAEGKA